MAFQGFALSSVIAHRGFSEQGFEIGKCHFDGIEVGRIEPALGLDPGVVVFQ